MVSRIERLGLVLMLALSCIAAAGQALAGPISTAVIERNAQGEWVERLVDSGYNAPATGAVENYDNWRSPDFGNGNTLWFNDLRIGGNEVGDDLQLAGAVGDIVDSVGIGHTNLSASSEMGDYSLTLRWYRRSSLEVVSEFSFAVRSVPLGPGERRFTYFPEGMLVGFNLRIEDDVYMTQQYTRVVGIPLADVGLVIGGPINTGTSSSTIRDFTTGQLIELGAVPQANLGLFVKTVPNPGAVIVLNGAAIAYASRRKRISR